MGDNDISIREYMELKFTMLTQSIEQLKEVIERNNSSNSDTFKRIHNRLDEMEEEVNKIKEQLKDLESLPAKEALEVKKKNMDTVRAVIIGVLITLALTIGGFTVSNYVDSLNDTKTEQVKK